MENGDVPLSVLAAEVQKWREVGDWGFVEVTVADDFHGRAEGGRPSWILSDGISKMCRCDLFHGVYGL